MITCVLISSNKRIKEQISLFGNHSQTLLYFYTVQHMFTGRINYIQSLSRCMIYKEYPYARDPEQAILFLVYWPTVDNRFLE